MAATWIFFPHRLLCLGREHGGRVQLLLESICCSFRLQRGWCASQAWNMQFRAQSALRLSDPERSWGRKIINIKKFGGIPPLLDCHVDVSRLSRGNVLFVPWTFYSIHLELNINQVGTSQMSRDSPPNSPPGTLPRHIDHQISLCVLCFFRFSPKS